MVAVAGFVPCAAIGHNQLVAMRFATRVMISANHGDSGEFTLCARHRRERHAVHAGDVFQISCNSYMQVKKPWPVSSGGQRMTIQKLRQHGVLIARTRVVLHRAGTERIEMRVDGEVLL